MLNNWLFIWCLDGTLVTISEAINFHKPWFPQSPFNSGFVAPYGKEHCDTLHGQKFVDTLTPHLLDEHFKTIGINRKFVHFVRASIMDAVICCHYWSCGVCGTQIWYYLNNVPQTYIRHCLWKSNNMNYLLQSIVLSDSCCEPIVYGGICYILFNNGHHNLLIKCQLFLCANRKNSPIRNDNLAHCKVTHCNLFNNKLILFKWVFFFFFSFFNWVCQKKKKVLKDLFF